MTALVHTKGQRIDVPAETVEFYKGNGWTVAGAEPDEDPAEVVIPEGYPSEKWKVEEIDAYAKREGIDFGGEPKKAEKLELIAKHNAAKA